MSKDLSSFILLGNMLDSTGFLFPMIKAHEDAEKKKEIERKGEAWLLTQALGDKQKVRM